MLCQLAVCFLIFYPLDLPSGRAWRIGNWANSTVSKPFDNLVQTGCEKEESNTQSTLSMNPSSDYFRWLLHQKLDLFWVLLSFLLTWVSEFQRNRKKKWLNQSYSPRFAPKSSFVKQQARIFSSELQSRSLYHRLKSGTELENITLPLQCCTCFHLVDLTLSMQFIF